MFAGPRIRRLRLERELTQTAMAGELGISPSYLNLLERDARPLTVPLLLKLAERFGIDVAELRDSDRAGTLATLRRVFAEPLIAAELPGEGELAHIADAAPNAAVAIDKLHRAFKEMEERLADLSSRLGATGTAAPLGRTPLDEVRATLEERPHHYPALETAAEGLGLTFGAGSGDDPAGALRRHLRERHDVSVRVLPVEAMPNWRRRFDRHSRRLFLSERLAPAERLREMAEETVRQGAREAVRAEADSFSWSGPEARRLAEREFVRLAALALLMPYAAFHAAAEALRSDAERLAARFGVSLTDAAERLASLGRRAQPGRPFFALESGPGGEALRRAGARGFPHARFGTPCPKLAALGRAPGRLEARRVAFPDGALFVLAVRAADAAPLADGADIAPTSVVTLGLDLDAARGTVYGERAAGETPPLGIGPGCRHCEREACLARTAPPVTRPLGLDEWVTGVTPFEFR